MTNYICINGKKAELTNEQLKALGIELPKTNPFERTRKNSIYYTIDTAGVTRRCNERNDGVDDIFYQVGNYCTDKEIMEQRALYEILNRLLWRYSMEHDGDKVEWRKGGGKRNWKIFYGHSSSLLEVDHNDDFEAIGTVYFHTKEIAEKAIDEIIKPFMEAHPDFKF